MSKSNSHLFKVGHTTYALITHSQTRAYAYLKEVMRVKKGQYKYLGVDNRTHKQQFESFTIGVGIPSDWRPLASHMARWANKDKAYALALERRLFEQGHE